MQAGLIEDLLALPGIQSLLGRIPEFEPTVKRCDDVNCKQSKLALRQQAAQAVQLAPDAA